MKEINIFCFGFGQVAKSFISKLNSENFKINLSTTTRQPTQNLKINNINYSNFQLDNKNFDKKLLENLKHAEHILISIPPIGGIDLIAKNFCDVLEKSNLKWVTYLSATSVYGDHNGDWVNEESKTIPTSVNGIDRLSAEKSWMFLAQNKKIPLQIFRLSGIYSNQKNILTRLKSGNVNLINKKNHFFSRIHLEDISNLLFKSLSNFKAGEIYNISDDKPCSSEEVTLYGVKMLNIDKPKAIEVKNIKSEMLKNFYNDSKRVSNKKMKIFFNYKLKFPTYIEGLNNIRDNFI